MTCLVVGHRMSDGLMDDLMRNRAGLGLYGDLLVVAGLSSSQSSLSASKSGMASEFLDFASL